MLLINENLSVEAEVDSNDICVLKIETEDSKTVTYVTKENLIDIVIYLGEKTKDFIDIQK